MIKAFVFKAVKNLIGFWAAKLIGPKAITELIITLGEAHAKRTDTKTDDKFIEWLKKHTDDDVIVTE